MIRLRFVEGGGWDSRIIQWDTRCRWSHVEYMLDEAHTLGAMLIGGVKIRSTADREYRNAKAYQLWDIDCTPKQQSDFVSFLQSQVGKPYDWRAIVSFGLGQRDWRNADAWFCDELDFRGLELAGIIKPLADMPVNRFTPRDLYWVCEGFLQGSKAMVRKPVSLK